MGDVIGDDALRVVEGERYVEHGEVPAGARLASWQKKVKGCAKDAAA